MCDGTAEVKSAFSIQATGRVLWEAQPTKRCLWTSGIQSDRGGLDVPNPIFRGIRRHPGASRHLLSANVQIHDIQLSQLVGVAIRRVRQPDCTDAGNQDQRWQRAPCPLRPLQQFVNQQIIERPDHR